MHVSINKETQITFGLSKDELVKLDRQFLDLYALCVNNKIDPERFGLIWELQAPFTVSLGE